MRIIKNKTNIDFIGKRRIAVFVSTLLNLAIVIGIALFGFNWGVDFAGGTLVEVKFENAQTPEQVRERLAAVGEANVQRVGAEEENTFLIRLGGTTQLTEDSRDAARSALEPLGMQAFTAQLDNGLINVRFNEAVDPERIREAVRASGTGVNEVRALGAAQSGGFEYQVVASGMSDRIVSALVESGGEDFQVRRVDYVGPQVGKQLRNRGILSLLWAMVGIGLYVAFRFDFKFGPGALVGLLHDLIMTAGYYLVTRREFNLTSVAVLLTVVGYSVNDTIVIYDRIREEAGKGTTRSLPTLINDAINVSMSRTLLTSGITMLSLVGLLIFGVGEIFDFAAAMLVGLFVGVYSTVFVASPMTIWVDERMRRRASTKPQRAAA